MFDIKAITSILPTDCGATCMKMFLAYYGKEVSLDTLVRECNTGVAGCSGKDLLVVGRAYGLDMKAYAMDAEELIRQDRPAIIWWKYGHWCLFCGKDESGKVVICNPDRGRYGLTTGTFTTLYTGVALFNGEPEDM